MNQLLRGAGLMGRQQEKIHLDTGETVYISGLALLKMLKHGKQGIPIEVIGLMLGSFIDDYTIQVVDVFATPQTANGTSVEAIDDKFQPAMLELLKQVGRPENVVGWYHSHPGYGVFLSSIDVEMQRNFEKLNPRCVAVVVDPVRSVRGKVVIAAFRSVPDMNPLTALTGGTNSEARETTSFTFSTYAATSHFHHPERTYYQMTISYKMSAFEENMLKSLNRPEWSTGFKSTNFDDEDQKNTEFMKGIKQCLSNYKEDIATEEKMSKRDYSIRYVGKVDPREYVRTNSEDISAHASSQLFRTNLNATTF